MNRAAIAALLSFAACKHAHQAEPPKAPAEKPAAAVPAPVPPAAPIDKTPIVVDLSKFEAVGGLKERGHHGFDDGESRTFYYSNGNAEVKIKVPAAGEYEVIVSASCTPALNEFAKFKLHVDGTERTIVTLTAEDAKEYKIPAALSAGEHKLGIEFTNDIYKENEYDRNLYVNGVKLVRVK